MEQRTQEITNRDIKDPRPGDVKNSYASIEKAKARLGYNVTISFDEGLIRVAVPNL